MARAGFTLIELMVVMACLALLMAVAVGATPQVGRHMAVKAAAVEARAALVRARAAAILRGREVAVVVDVGARTLMVSDEARPVALPPDAGLVFRTATDQVVDDDAGRILFRPDGTSSGGRLVLSRPGSDGGGYDVSVNWLTGRISMDAR